MIDVVIEFGFVIFALLRLKREKLFIAIVALVIFAIVIIAQEKTEEDNKAGCI